MILNNKRSKSNRMENENLKRIEFLEGKLAKLLEESEEIKIHNYHQADTIRALRCQISQKDMEINRLHHILQREEPSPPSVVDYCCHCNVKDNKIKSLEKELEGTMEKQHEAMNRALQLAEKNQLLERELKCIDKVALKMEEQCQYKIKQNLKNMQILQKRLQEKIDEIRCLEETVQTMRTKINHYEVELENIRAEKKSLEKNFNSISHEKKHLDDKINNYVLVEKKLNSEILRLQDVNKSLQKQIEDMEARVMGILGMDNKNPKKLKSRLNKPSNLKSTSCVHLNSHLQKALREEKESCSENHCSQMNLLDRVQQERNFYHDQFHCLKQQLESHPSHSETSLDLLKQLRDRDKEVSELKHETFMLRRENEAVLRRLENNEHVPCSSGDSIKIILDRLERERDMAFSDISRLQGERDALREKIKAATECQIGEQARLQKILSESEERIRRLESERRELISSQSSQRIALSNLEEKYDECKDQNRKVQSELAQLTANYNQLKTLQEETDRSLSECQNRVSQTALELKMSSQRVKELEKTKTELENEISCLKNEKSHLKSCLTFIEKEKDALLINLDEKTEKLALLEKQIKNQESHVLEKNEKVLYLEKQLDFVTQEKTNVEHNLRALERSVERLKEEAEKLEKQRETLIRENRRLQDDLASAAKDCLTARRELDGEKQEVENLKKQLQQYVSEVKRAEELLSEKESERNQMLDHFRSLSLEATALETNNHSLESTVENAKSQLISAKNRISDLERQVDSKDSLLCSYEKQIAELTSQIAELEEKLRQQTEQKIRAEEDLAALRDLCSTIDGQKEALRKQACHSDAEKSRLVDEVRRLSEEYEGLNAKLNHERNLSQTLEISLSNSRQETLEHKISNKDLQTQVQQLRQKVNELTEKLDSESDDVRRYQAQCAELSQQVSELRREVTNARFEKARASESARRDFPLSSSDPDDFDEGGKKNKIDSQRNIPPLTFPDDSDRTVSLDSRENFEEINCDQTDKTIKRSYWLLSPLLEKFEDKLMEDRNVGLSLDTASELSSLPEDSEPKNSNGTVTISGGGDFAPRPTYSIRETSTYDICSKCDSIEISPPTEEPRTHSAHNKSHFQILGKDYLSRSLPDEHHHFCEGFSVEKPTFRSVTEACEFDCELYLKSEVDEKTFPIARRSPDLRDPPG